MTVGGIDMPKTSWSAKRERQFVHLKDSLLRSGKGCSGMNKAQLEQAFKR